MAMGLAASDITSQRRHPTGLPTAAKGTAL
jgi:hypothetical protein